MEYGVHIMSLQQLLSYLQKLVFSPLSFGTHDPSSSPCRQVQSEIQGHKGEQVRVIGELNGEKDKMKVQMVEMQRELQYTTEALDKAKRSYTSAGRSAS